MPETDSRKNRISLLIIFSIGLGPLLLAYIIYLFFPHLLPSVTTNNGQLILPPISSEALGIRLKDSKWSLIIPVGDVCDEECERRFYLARQVNVALGKEAGRVKRIVLALTNNTSATLEVLMEKYKGLELVRVTDEIVDSEFKDVLSDVIDGGYILLMDPNGNIMMYYSLDKAGKPMLLDLKHLLKVSGIG